jgi:GNAT superfamily N-acetyltransferase
MINELVKIYIDGFVEDGEDYAKYFCQKHKDCAITYPPKSPKSAGYVIPKRLSSGSYCAYFSAIATIRRERGKGYASALIKEMLDEAYEKGYPFAVLSPFNSDFYKQFGFFTTQYYQRTILNGTDDAKILPMDNIDVSSIQSLFSIDAVRLAFDEEYLLKLRKETAVYNAMPVKIVKDGEIYGFCVKENSSISRVVQKDNAVTNNRGFSGFNTKLASNNGEAFIQLRVTSIKEFVKFLKPNDSFIITVTVVDSLIKDNSGNWEFSSNGRDVVASKTDKKADFEVNIADLVETLEGKKLIKPFLTQFIDEY